jgi:hypothetical protein
MSIKQQQEATEDYNKKLFSIGTIFEILGKKNLIISKPSTKRTTTSNNHYV